MASLSDTLKNRRQGQLKRGPGGQLTQETPEELQSLAGQAGLQAPPITPLGTAIIGANKDQQKMAGTPAQKQAALSLAAQPVEQGLSGAVRRMQARSQMTGEEQQQKEKSQDMMNLGSLGDRVTSFIDSQRQKLQTQAQAPTTQTNALGVTSASTFQGKDVSSIKSKLDQFRKEPNNQQLLLEINQALGYNINTQLSPEQVNDLYESAVDTITRGGAGIIDNDLTVQDLLDTGNLGYTPEELSQLLGKPANQISNLSVGQLRSEIERVGQEEFSRTQELEQQAQSGTLGLAERQLARQAGREMSATGIRATEADYSNMEQQIQNADMVQFGGKEYKVDELLQDETISNIIKDYMEAAPGSPIREQVDKLEPALKQFIEKNSAVLQEASAAMQAGAQEFRAIQEANKGLTRFADGLQISPELAAKVIPGYGQLSAARIDRAAVPFLAAMDSVPNQAAAINQISELEQSFGDTFTDQLAGLTKQEILTLKPGKSDGPLEKWATTQELRQRVEKTSPNDLDSLYQIQYGINANTANSFRKEGNRRSVLGVETGLPSDILDPSSLYENVKSAVPSATLADAARGYNPTFQQKQVPAIKPLYQNTPEGYWNNYLGQTGYADDGSLNGDEIRDLVSRESQGTVEGLQRVIQLEDMLSKSGKGDTATLGAERQRLTDANTAREINSSRAEGDPARQLTNYFGLLNTARQNGRIINPNTLTQEILRTVAHEMTVGAKGNGSEPIEFIRKVAAQGIDISPLREFAQQYAARLARGPARANQSALYNALGMEDTYTQEAEAQKTAKSQAEMDKWLKSERAKGRR